MKSKTALRVGERAFSLTDLLVVMAVLACLMAVLLPVSVRAKRKAGEAGCLANLRQTGLALNVWAHDNDGWLPPGAGATEGLTVGQRCDYQEKPGYGSSLVYYLAPSLGDHPPDATPRICRAFCCPGLEVRADDVLNMAERISYGVSRAGDGTLPGSAGLPFNPFGYPASTGPGQPPHKLTEIQSFCSLSEVWALADIDQVSVPANSGDWVKELPDQPVHGSVRNYLFFDGHAASKPIDRPEAMATF
ncbi:MAG: type II secretion system protein [Verrucomicrobiota bacterium]